MSTNQTWNSFGAEVRDAIQDALQTGDFKNFNDVVANAATEAVKNAKEQFGQNNPAPKENYTEKWVREHKAEQTFRGNWQSPNEKWQPQKGQNRATQKKQPAGTQTGRYMPARVISAPFKKIGNVSGTLFQVFGGIGTGVLAVLTTVFFGLGLGLGGGFWTAFWVLGFFLALCVGMINVGTKQKHRVKRAQKYLELAGNNHYVNLEDIALHTNKDLKYILKDLKRMLSDGFYPEGHLDRQESCLMLDDRIYSEYLSLEKQRRIQEQEQKVIQAKPEPEKNKAEQKKPETDGKTEADTEVAAMVAEGQDCIRKLRDMNDNIAGEVISAKLFRLENLLKEIFDRLKEHPEQTTQMQKFLKYYLPTTLKLVAAYEEFDSLSEQGEDIVEAKVEIEKTLDTINSAFSELLNRLLRDTAYDVTTDAQVLQTMLAKEGLTREPEFEYVESK